MSDDQAPVANQTPASPPSGLEDYFGEEVKDVQTDDQADATGKEKVNSDGKENKEAVADTTKENKPEGKPMTSPTTSLRVMLKTSQRKPMKKPLPKKRKAKTVISPKKKRIKKTTKRTIKKLKSLPNLK